jgi:predicted nuclease of restriction endonuclease-like (RecB) superfamily
LKRQKKQAAALVPTSDAAPAAVLNALLVDVRALIAQARERTAQAVNAEMTMLYWHIGDRIRREILGEERAAYGEQIIATLSRQLTAEYSKGFSSQILQHMIRFAEVFRDEKILSTLWRELSWSHFREIMYLKDRLKRDFYVEMCRLEKWSVRALRAKINGMLFERTALARKPDELIEKELKALREEDSLTPDLVFRDPYVLDFLGLHDGYSERDLETAILRELEAFLLELGAGFAFVARQKRITIDGEDFYIDLLFYHRRLRRLIVLELKLEPFSAAHKGQLELYLRWLDRYERAPGEEAPIGLILCAEKRREQIELLQLDQGDIRVAEYLTEKLPSALLERKLHEAIRRARERLALPETDAEGQA